MQERACLRMGMHAQACSPPCTRKCTRNQWQTHIHTHRSSRKAHLVCMRYSTGMSSRVGLGKLGRLSIQAFPARHSLHWCRQLRLRSQAAAHEVIGSCA